jgi:thioredoxin reductase
MTVADVKKNTEQKMQKSIDTLKADLAKVRTGRAHAGILDHVQVDYYGTPTHISQVANITLLDARTIGVQPWEKKMVPVVDKATFMSTRPGVFFGGDAAFGPANIIWAVEHGHQAAISIHQLLLPIQSAFSPCPTITNFGKKSKLQNSQTMFCPMGTLNFLLIKSHKVG